MDSPGERARSGSAKKILLVDDHKPFRDTLAKILAGEGWHVLSATDGEEALEILRHELVHLVLTDLKMPKMDGVELLKVAKTIRPEAEVVLITGYGTVDTAVKAMKDGAFDFIQKPFKPRQIIKLVRLALEKQSLILENRLLQERIKDFQKFERIIGRSPAMQQVLEVVAQVAPSSATVLIQGESGTGKEVIAQAIHDLSPRAKRPFVKVSCAALPETLLEAELFGYERGAFTGANARKEGRFELAHEGTLFLDEIGEVSSTVQVKLLRVLQVGEFERLGGTRTIRADVRLVAATNMDLLDAVERKAFREDLFSRLNVITLTLPPLRERNGDIPLLAHHFLEIFKQKNHKTVEGFTSEAMAVMTAYGWPRNVRQLENAIERAVVLAKGSMITPADLPPEIIRAVRGPASSLLDEKAIHIPLGTPLEEVERQVIEETLRHSRGDKNLASKILGISARTIYRKIDEEKKKDALTNCQDKGG
ncbi:MAG: sigma-54-dependent Fis family transcriptional regulator [Deltaproteobacteria bacterium]|nr:sigma-54-dependent Fis family transcriptional regulator [Deltaproteobacteria bacterium]